MLETKGLGVSKRPPFAELDPLYASSNHIHLFREEYFQIHRPSLPYLRRLSDWFQDC